MSPCSHLAKLAVEIFVKEGKKAIPPSDLPEELFKRKSGVFVSIHIGKELRGCIGTYLPTCENVAKEIIRNAISAATEDYRFDPISERELPHLSYEVYLLEKPMPVKNISELNPKRYGIIIRTANPPQKSGLLLPNLEGIDTTEQQISIACQKAGINPEKEKIIIYKFTVEKYK